MFDALATLAALLRKYAPRQATVVERLVEAAARDQAGLAGALTDEAIWGEGGLWDSGPQVLQRPHHDPVACRQDELAYRRALLELAVEVERRQCGTPAQRARVAEVAATFRAWERDDL